METYLFALFDEVSEFYVNLINMCDKYGEWTVHELKTELKKRNAKCTGRKEFLIKRLEAYDRNNNFTDHECHNQQEDEQPATSVDWPPENTFVSVQKSSVVPKIDIVHINQYFLQVYKGQEGLSMYAAVHRKGYNMMKENFLLSLVQSNTTDLCFYRAQVNSEMTKNMTYFVNIVINLQGYIVEGNCECIAGKGTKAICKHVSTVCYAILQFKESGSWYIRKTCTDNKQVWHMPKRKKMDISPLKAEQLNLSVLEYNVKKKETSNMCYDPRPLEYRNMPIFRDRVHNAVTNFNNIMKRTLAISGAFPIASFTGLTQDHDYLLRPLAHQFIWNCIQVSDDIGYVVYSALGSFYIPSCIMVFVYIRIYYAAKARARRGIRKNPRPRPNDQQTSFSNPKGTRPMPATPTIPMPQGDTNNSVRDNPISTIEAQQVAIPTVTCDLASDISTSEAGDTMPDERKDTLKVVTSAQVQRNLLTTCPLRSSTLSINGEAEGRTRAASVAIDTDMVSEMEPSSSDSGVVSRCAVVKPLKLRIFKKTERRTEKSQNSKAELEPALPKPHKPRDPEREKRRIARKKEKRATLILGLIMGSFIACWLPFFFLYILKAACRICVIPGSAFSIAFWLGYMNSVLNPVIYTIFNKDFRRAFRRILFK